MDVKVVAQVPVSTSTYVVAAVRLLGALKPAIVIVALADVAVNLNHTSLVLAAISPQPLAKPLGVAPCRSPVIGAPGQVIEGVNIIGLLQLSCPNELIDENITSPKDIRMAKR